MKAVLICKVLLDENDPDSCISVKHSLNIAYGMTDEQVKCSVADVGAELVADLLQLVSVPQEEFMSMVRKSDVMKDLVNEAMYKLQDIIKKGKVNNLN